MNPFRPIQIYLELFGLFRSGVVLYIEWDNAVIPGQDLELNRKLITLFLLSGQRPNRPTLKYANIVPIKIFFWSNWSCKNLEIVKNILLTIKEKKAFSPATVL